MNDITAEAWLTQEIQDLLGEGPVGLYEFIWGLNGTAYGLPPSTAIELSRQVAHRFVTSGQAEIFAVQWPDFEVVEGPLPLSVLEDPSAWSEGESGPRMFIDVNNDGYVSPADALAVINQLNAEGEDPLLVKYTLQPINAAGTSISTVQSGSDFYLQLLGTDLRADLFNRPDNNSDGDPDENLRGVYAAYMDILYENNLGAPAVSEVQSITVPAGGNGSFTLTYAGFTTAGGASITRAA